MASERTDELYKVLLDRGYPKEFCAEIAYKNMNTDYTAARLLGYLYRKRHSTHPCFPGTKSLQTDDQQRLFLFSCSFDF